MISDFLFMGVHSCLFWVLPLVSIIRFSSFLLLNMGTTLFNSVICQHTISAKRELQRTDEFNDAVGGREGGEWSQQS